MLDITGQRFIHLTAIEPVGKDKSGRVIWKCLCDCGNYCQFRSQVLKRSKTISCSSSCPFYFRRTLGLEGQRFGKLKVQKMDGHKKNEGFMWLCLCDCGNTIRVSTGYLVNRSRRSCGCKPHNLLDEGEAAKNVLYKAYKSAASDREISWSLTKDEFLSFTKLRCHYCNSPPNKIIKRKHLNGSYTYSGLDRIDNNKGYSVKNCVPCCTQCNRMKHVYSYDEFLTQVSLIYKNMKRKSLRPGSR